MFASGVAFLRSSCQHPALQISSTLLVDWILVPPQQWHHLPAFPYCLLWNGKLADFNALPHTVIGCQLLTCLYRTLVQGCFHGKPGHVHLFARARVGTHTHNCERTSSVGTPRGPGGNLVRTLITSPSLRRELGCLLPHSTYSFKGFDGLILYLLILLLLLYTVSVWDNFKKGYNYILKYNF